jgi:hypothetical protein
VCLGDCSRAVGEAKNVLTRLGLQVTSSFFEGKDTHVTHHELTDGPAFQIVFTAENSVVSNLRVGVTGETSQATAYSLDSLIKRLGPPSNVEFWICRGEVACYGIVMYWDDLDLIVQYYSLDVDHGDERIRVCPIQDEIFHVRLWLGPDPENPPFGAIALKEAASMTAEKFSQLMTGDPLDACLDLNVEIFP